MWFLKVRVTDVAGEPCGKATAILCSNGKTAGLLTVPRVELPIMPIHHPYSEKNPKR